MAISDLVLEELSGRVEALLARMSDLRRHL